MPGLWPATLLLLLSACCPPRAAHGVPAPLGNLRVDPETATLTWDLLGNLSDIRCFKSTYPGALHSCLSCDSCKIGFMRPCTVTNYSVAVARPPFVAWVLFPSPDDNATAAARNLSCRTRDAGPVWCDWAVGTGAPEDVQYRLSWQDLKVGQARGGCVHYTTDARGRNSGCRLDAGVGLAELVRVTVRGTSNATRVPCAELDLSLRDVETFSAPNISSDCNRTEARMSWAPPRSHFSKRFKYQLRIEQIPGRPAKPTQISETSFQLPNPGTYTAQIRASDGSRWTAWSAPQTFTCDTSENPQVRLWSTALPVAVGTVLLVAAVAVACRRSGLLARVFPQLPPMKDPLADTPQEGQLMPWEAGQEDCPISELQLVVEK